MGRLVLISILLVSSVFAQAQTEESDQFWFEADLFYRISPKVRLLGIVQSTQDRNLGSTDLFAGAYVDFGLRPIIQQRIDSLDYEASPLDFLRLRLGAAFLTTPNATVFAEEVRFIADLTPRYRAWDRVLIALRNRTEYRFVEGEFSFRYRPRIWVEYTFYDVLGITLTPLASYELYYDTIHSQFFRARSVFGVGFGITSWFAPEARIVHQADWVGGGTDIVAFDLILTFYI